MKNPEPFYILHLLVVKSLVMSWRILFRFQMNANLIIDGIFGRRGQTPIQETQLQLIRQKISLMETKIESKRVVNENHLKHLKKRKNILEMEIFHVFSIMCKFSKESKKF